ncbi:PREDICTED: BEL1 homeodomain [Prunus dulcis]|uniref:PREDICTED: BEL1 homeodomain n=1 Tax=Prunus dulcis TaxID=3755 RepID=A0A5E4ENG5_PRUDU|nr:PREDICTED: BEL1 homeodomain [Prunus dulcis]
MARFSPISSKTESLVVDWSFVKVEDIADEGNPDSSIGDLSSYGMSSIARAIPNNEYFKAAQQLLDEVVNVQKTLKQHDREKNQSTHEHRDDGSKNELESHISSNPQDTASNSQCELSHAEKQELQSKLTKLLFMLDEV